MDFPDLVVVIATALGRKNWLLGRSLPSVYGQMGVVGERVRVLVVDDHVDANVYGEIVQGVDRLRREMGVPEGCFVTEVLRNVRSVGMSGTGAWNTGLAWTYTRYGEGYVSILDDDDRYLPGHLARCVAEIEEGTLGVFGWLYWQEEDGRSLGKPFGREDLTPEGFFVGSPGVQGSNLFVKAEAMRAIGGFDEDLPNTTDRDLMIRLLWYAESAAGRMEEKIKVVEKYGVVHYNHRRCKVNVVGDRKRMGLRLFYEKYSGCFDEEALELSLARAERIFGYVHGQ